MNPKDLGLPEGVIMVDMNSPTFPEDLAAAIGEPLQDCEFVTPQFKRVDGRVIDMALCPKTKSEWCDLASRSTAELIEAGCQVWDQDVHGHTHWLFPVDWYSCIPEGMPVFCIDNETEDFAPGVTDDDHRFGCLPFGFLQPNTTAPE